MARIRLGDWRRGSGAVLRIAVGDLAGAKLLGMGGAGESKRGQSRDKQRRAGGGKRGRGHGPQVEQDAERRRVSASANGVSTASGANRAGNPTSLPDPARRRLLLRAVWVGNRVAPPPRTVSAGGPRACLSPVGQRRQPVRGLEAVVKMREPLESALEGDGHEHRQLDLAPFDVPYLRRRNGWKAPPCRQPWGAELIWSPEPTTSSSLFRSARRDARAGEGLP